MPPPPPRKGRGGLVAFVVVLMLLVVGGGGGAAWWFLSEPGGDGGSPGADGLTIEDTESGIAYTAPDAWVEADSGDLIEAFTSSASFLAEEGGAASVVAFSGEAMTDEEMSFSTSTIAGENSEYFYPYAEDRQILISEPTEVDGQEAYRFTWEVSKSDEAPMYGHIVHILTDDNRSVFLMGMAHGDDPAMRTEVDAVIGSVSLL
jgi:hypothetical protein